jgi:D-glycero-alpha-D-manno-heptose-7-phosphate kinase
VDQPLRIIHSVAPVRLCDNGGWTDTWFAEYGTIFNIGVSPFVEVQLQVYPGESPRPRVTLHAENYNVSYAPDEDAREWGSHPLLEAVVRRMGIPDDVRVVLNIYSDVPAGAATGTSASVSVAMIGALDALTPGRLGPHDVARLAQSIETDMLKQQCGIQDQLCAAFGGINLIEMHCYPEATVTPVKVSDMIWWELERRLLLVYLGKSHVSSDMHESVIRELEHQGPEAPGLVALRQTAVPSRDALLAGDFCALGAAMIQNTEAQRRLHAELICDDADRVIALARAHGAVGWKVNGAGGDGGSLTILCGEYAPSKRALTRALSDADSRIVSIPVRLSRHGLRVWG